MKKVVALFLLLALQTTPFEIVTTHLPVPKANQPYSVQLAAQGGKPPYHWIARSTLPYGLELNPDTGLLSGKLYSAAPFSIVIEASDSSSPPLHQTLRLPSASGPPLELSWTSPPAVGGDHMTGGLEVENGSGETVEVTAVVVAINEHGKAYSLRYEHRRLEPGERTPELGFDVFLPAGTYQVRADAAAENPTNRHILRGALRAGPLSVH